MIGGRPINSTTSRYVRKFGEATGWTPQVDVHTGIAQLAEWLKDSARVAVLPVVLRRRESSTAWRARTRKRFPSSSAPGWARPAAAEQTDLEIERAGSRRVDRQNHQVPLIGRLPLRCLYELPPLRDAVDAQPRAAVGRMRAAVLTGPRQAHLESLPRLEPDGRNVRVRLEGCGVCGSNLPPWEGRPWFKYPLPAGRAGARRLGDG